MVIHCKMEYVLPAKSMAVKVVYHQLIHAILDHVNLVKYGMPKKVNAFRVAQDAKTVLALIFQLVLVVFLDIIKQPIPVELIDVQNVFKIVNNVLLPQLVINVPRDMLFQQMDQNVILNVVIPVKRAIY